ncbi:hypothetical protein MGMO_29c00240 [Methyloglobulus morosus KoM1]|uniref:Uncharacterized protein n=1 Tax=Methyloglobulus morosus KoM1 TaxID=1116472 RepID=V5C923_9GAMM|nr:hypothetical protein [Methyloglobulus morosus]ESS73253.1 hypothetical protein MGMO_29c00240 [Methyloglobulus morosus KoM1]
MIWCAAIRNDNQEHPYNTFIPVHQLREKKHGKTESEHFMVMVGYRHSGKPTQGSFAIIDHRRY